LHKKMEIAKISRVEDVFWVYHRRKGTSVEIFRNLFRKSRGAAGISIDIEDRRGIRRKLQELCNQRNNCEVIVEGMLFSSIFLSLEDDQFLMDILMPSKGNDFLKVGESYKVNYQDRAVPFTMKCRYQGQADTEGFSALLFGLPEIIRYSNRRSYYRVAPKDTSPLRIIIDFGDVGSFDGGAKDISGGGVAVKSNISSKLEPGAKVGTVEIMLPTGSWIICKGIVRRVSGSVIGIELEDVPNRDRRQIVRYVTDRQKEEIRAKRDLR
jgi:c-di-GMP-binding flagellar brake protein YcgR